MRRTILATCIIILVSGAMLVNVKAFWVTQVKPPNGENNEVNISVGSGDWFKELEIIITDWDSRIWIRFDQSLSEPLLRFTIQGSSASRGFINSSMILDPGVTGIRLILPISIQPRLNLDRRIYNVEEHTHSNGTIKAVTIWRIGTTPPASVWSSWF